MIRVPNWPGINHCDRTMNTVLDGFARLVTGLIRGVNRDVSIVSVSCRYCVGAGFQGFAGHYCAGLSAFNAPGEVPAGETDA